MILCSTGVLVEADREHVESILRLGPRLPADGLEVLVLRDMIGTLADAGKRLADCGMAFPAVHAPKLAGSLIPGEGVRQLAEAARFARTIGARVVVLHLWDLPESDTDFGGRLEAAVVAANIAEDEGVGLAVETIPCSQSTPLKNVERVIEHEPRLSIALDTEFLAYHGEIDAALHAGFLWERPVVRHIHLKDYAGTLVDESGRRRYHAPGDGAIDFPGFFAALQRHGYDGAVSLESASRRPQGGPDVDRIAATLKRISMNPWAFA